MEIENWNGFYMVEYCGDEIVFNTLEEAEQFIKEVSGD